ncbi:hypothetical protein [Paenibacillus typhae]|uniref:hypothetical protein n=1 Tax=Paenibacillus typhae TaxID=1174501 RepID=UPI000B83ECBD
MLELANRKLSRFLEGYEVKQMPQIHVRLDEAILLPGDACLQTADWDAEYAWFYVEPGDGGGTDAYYCKVDELTLEIWDSFREYGDTYINVNDSLSIGHYWSFRRSAGQPAIINLAYGLIASALAELTKGYIYSDDGAWYGRPVGADKFDSLYFIAEKADTIGNALWYENCLEQIVTEYTGKPLDLRYQQFECNERSREQRLVYYPSGRLFSEGPAEEDRLFMMLSLCGDFPYWIINLNDLAVDRDALFQQIRLLDVKNGHRLTNHPVTAFMAEYKNLKILLERPDVDFWANPLCIEDAEVLKRQLT